MPVSLTVLQKVEDQQPIHNPGDSQTVTIVLPFKDQDSVDLKRKELKDLSQKTLTVN